MKNEKQCFLQEKKVCFDYIVPPEAGGEMEISMQQKKDVQQEIEGLIVKAMEARKNSYSPYSHFQVGACLQGKSGMLYTGCNVENAGYSATNCAERTAFFYAVSQGEKEFSRIAIVGGKEGDSLEFCPPCGICRQVMMEFCNPGEFEIILAMSQKEYRVFLLKDLFPFGFGKENVQGEKSS